MEEPNAASVGAYGPNAAGKGGRELPGTSNDKDNDDSGSDADADAGGGREEMDTNTMSSSSSSPVAAATLWTPAAFLSMAASAGEEEEMPEEEEDDESAVVASNWISAKTPRFWTRCFLSSSFFCLSTARSACTAPKAWMRVTACKVFPRPMQSPRMQPRPRYGNIERGDDEDNEDERDDGKDDDDADADADDDNDEIEL